MNAWDKFRKIITKNDIVKPEDKIVLAVSGGPDSVCLTHLFWRLRKTCSIDLMIVYLDHGLRKQAKKEIKFIQNLGGKLNIPVEIYHIPVKEYSVSEKTSIETAGRELRYRILMECAQKNRFNKIATGHNANDNAETMLMWLVRGTGTEGLSGIPAARDGNKKVKIIRPILSCTRKEISAYLRSQRLSFCIDRSNFSPDYTRNRIRHEVVPLLEKFNPCFVEHLYNLSQIIGSENEYFDNLTKKAVKTLVFYKKSGILLDLKRFLGYNKQMQSRIIKTILPEKRSVAQVERLLDWIALTNQSKMNFSKNWAIEKNENKIFFKKISEK